MEKWTKGEWKTVGACGSVYPNDPKRPTVMGGKDGKWCVAIVQTDNNKPYKNNANLICASPDLYAALKNCVRIMDKGEQSPDDLENVYQAAVAALDKANGGEV